jgi:hypothetical protein
MKRCYQDAPPMPHRLLVLLPSFVLFACDAPADKAAPASKPDAKAAKVEAKADAKLADAKADAKAEDAKAQDAKAEDAKAEDAGAPVDAAASAFKTPSTPEEAARQLAQRLADPDKTPEPALFSATKEIELLEICAGCDDPKKESTSSKLANPAALEKRGRELAEQAGAGVISFEEKIECKDDCCAFVPDPELGVGDTVANLEKICMALDAGGKPTAYTRVEISG